MGGGNSVLAAPPGMNGEIAAKMAAEYERLKGTGQSDDQLRTSLESLYVELCKTKPLTTAAKAPTGAPPELKVPTPAASPAGKGIKPAVGLPKGGAGKGGASKPTVQRRRSFENDSTSSVPKKAVGLVMSQSDATMPTTQTLTDVSTSLSGGEASATSDGTAAALPPNKDNWDSVSQLPYCTICQMAFKSASLLERHVKYSDLHERTSKKQQAAAAEAAASPAPPEDLDSEMQLQQEKQVEGKDYKHLYYGSKFFWRTSDNIDFTFFLHLLVDTIEVVGFSVYKNKELSRLYLNMYMVKVKLEEGGQLEPFSDKHLKSAKEKQEALQKYDEQSRIAVTSFVLARLQLDTKPTGEQVVYYQPAGGDDTKTTPLLSERPLLLVPRPVVHRRNTSTEEVNRKLEDLRLDQIALSQATSRAEKVGQYVVSFTTNFKKSSKRLSGLNPVRRRWVMAINRVLQINGVERTINFLKEQDEREKLNEPKQGKGGRRVRSNTGDR